MGAKPVALSSAFIIEEMVINTSGIGKESKFLKSNFEEVSNYRHTKTKWLADSNLGEGDKIIISGNIGEHGIALISCREGYGFQTKIKSDVAPINGLMENLLRIGGITSAKDPTRGGIANALNEMSEKSKVGIIIEEDKIPITDGVKSACDMLGIDALEIGNEGKVILGVVKEKAEDILHQLRKHPLGKNAEIIGEVTNAVEGVVLKTSIGGKRILDKPLGDPIPRIC